jgi:hypothetical protein
MRQQLRQPQKILLLPRSQSPANKIHPRHLAMYYVGYGLCGFVGGLVLEIIAFLLFLSFSDWLGIGDPAGNSGALLALVVLETGVLAIYTVLAIRRINNRVSKARERLPSYRIDLDES